MRLRLLPFLVVASALSFAQQSPCESKCNLKASECMKSCTGDPKEAQRPEKSEGLVQCLKQCEAQTSQCKQTCRGS